MRSIAGQQMPATSARGTPFGNPFVIWIDGDRETVIARYRSYLRERIDRGDRGDREIVETMRGRR